MSKKHVIVRLLHASSIPNARWCEPVGWEPTNVVDGAVFDDGAWWGDYDQAAGLIWVGKPDEYGNYEIIEASVDDVRVATCGDCRVIGKVTL